MPFHELEAEIWYSAFIPKSMANDYSQVNG
jgi:hypothetical protein